MESQPKKENTIHLPRSLFFPLLLIGLGIMLLLQNLKIVTGTPGQVIAQFWPILLVVMGLDGLYQRKGFATATLFTVTGGYLLLANLGYVSFSSWITVLQLWPVLLVGWGLDILIGNRSIWACLAASLGGFALSALVIWVVFSAPVFSRPGDLLPIQQELGNATSADINISHVSGHLMIEGGAGAKNLIEGSAEKPAANSPEVSYSLNNKRANFDLNWASGNYPNMGPGSNTGFEWGLKLNDTIPMDLETEVVFGAQELDLRTTQLETLKSSTIFGLDQVTFPAEGSYQADLDVIFGGLKLSVPKDAAVRIRADMIRFMVSLPEGYVWEDDVALSPAAQRGEGNPIEIEVTAIFGGVEVVTH